jgi:hypothetical protein
MLDPDVTERASREAEDRFDAALREAELRPEPLRNPTRGKAPDRLVLDADTPLALLEVKLVASGGYNADENFHESTLDPAFPLDGKARVMPAIPPRLDDAIQVAAGQHREYVRDVPERAALPFILALEFDPFAATPAVDPRRPGERNISGFLRRVTGRRNREAFLARPKEERNRRLREGDLSGLPPAEETELDFYPNPYAVRPLGGSLKRRFRTIRPSGLPWPDHLSPEVEAGAAEEWKTLPQADRVVLRMIYDGFGRITPQRRGDYAELWMVVEDLVARSLAKFGADGGVSLTNRGLTLGLVGVVTT